MIHGARLAGDWDRRGWCCTISVPVIDTAGLAASWAYCPARLFPLPGTGSEATRAGPLDQPSVLTNLGTKNGENGAAIFERRMAVGRRATIQIFAKALVLSSSEIDIFAEGVYRRLWPQVRMPLKNVAPLSYSGGEGIPTAPAARTVGRELAGPAIRGLASGSTVATAQGHAPLDQGRFTSAFIGISCANTDRLCFLTLAARTGRTPTTKEIGSRPNPGRRFRANHRAAPAVIRRGP